MILDAGAARERMIVDIQQEPEINSPGNKTYSIQITECVRSVEIPKPLE